MPICFYASKLELLTTQVPQTDTLGNQPSILIGFNTWYGTRLNYICAKDDYSLVPF
jgi:hypothetical protein